ncbi:hypothetical protein AQI95_31620 [Streptomyces yokosukanensis]|uniref:2Fe-2S ferredoxin-type domain-containing protein n=1 Tax=Streptomyces yokosukanensis TaxID=67386 RepID=A0A117Q030_9ACTN|nr:2Fe-2S iron-sulfur cluster-binding protein [Streptomyces yokosukanensis]KUN01469.1 hypothetical protein AQI95_31620 [Streptomyces yokosukanensis]
MTDDQHGEGAPQSGGRWDPLPQGDYDDGATAFVKLPEGGIDALLSGDSPLAAPGHGYVPPRITVAPGTGDPAATGTWTAPTGAVEWPDPNAPQTQPADDRFTYQPGTTQQWTFEEPAAPAAPGHDVTGQWSIPVAGGDLPDESGEFTTSSLVEQWGGTPPATLPGGAPAPWVTEEAGRSWDRPADTGRTDLPDHTGAHPGGGSPEPAPGGPAAQGYAQDGPYTPGERYARDERFGPDGQYAPDEQYGHGPAGHEETRHEAAAPEAAGHETAGHDDPAHAHAEAGGSGESTRPAQPRAASAAMPDADGRGPAEAPERPADGPAGHDGSAGPAQGPQAATAPATAEPAAPRTPAAAAEPEPTADTPVAAVPDRVTSEALEAPGEDDTPEDAAGTTGEGTAPRPEAAAEEHPAPQPPHDDHPLASYVLRVNGADRPVTDAWIGESLLYVLRERLGLAGAKDGCSQGECGACNVQVDGRLVASCLVPAVTAAGSEVRTVEGLAADGQPSDVQRALARCGAVQCGFCVPGMAMTVHDLLEGNPAPSELETRQALCGNLCRCSGYRGVLDAVKEVVAERETAHATGDPGTDGDEVRIPHQAGPGSGGVNPSAFEAPGAFDTPPTAPAGYGDAQDPYGAPDPYGTPGPHDPNGPHDQHYGQDGGQA